MFFLSTSLYPAWKIRESGNEILFWLLNINPFTHNVELIRHAAYNSFNLNSFIVVTICGFLFFLASIYGYSPKFGLEISICKRNSFHPKMKHITPYYSKKELLKLGKNMKLIKDNSNYDLLDQETHYKICKQISKNDISVDTILQHSQYIIKKKMVQLIMYYSLNGSFLMNIQDLQTIAQNKFNVAIFLRF